MKKILIIALALSATTSVFAQIDPAVVDSSLAKKTKGTTSSSNVNTNQDGIYTNRPGIQDSKTAIGGYMEANTNYFVEDGITEGLSAEMRRFNIFLYSRIGKRIRMLTELEFEHGTEEIAIETAIMDFTIDPAFNLRGGILLPPVGMFNINHDSPLWDVVDRPIVSTEIIPSTLSEVGFGAFGKFYKSNWIFTYDVYAVNGLQDGVILNNTGRTSLSEGKSEEMFGEDNNGTPMYTGRLGIRNRNMGEIGFSYYGGAYNTYKLDGEDIDVKNSLHLMAFDLSAQYKNLSVTGEAATTTVQLPTDLEEFLGSKQWGAFVDFKYKFLSKPVLRFDNVDFNAVLRLEAADFNVGTFSTTGANIGDQIQSLTAGVSMRPGPSTVLKLSYKYSWITDILSNPKVKAAGIQFGFATYF